MQPSPFPTSSQLHLPPASLSPIQDKLGQETDLLEDVFVFSSPSCQISSLNWLIQAQQLNTLNLMSQAWHLFLYNFICQHRCTPSGSSFCSGGQTTKELKDPGINNFPCWEEWKLPVWWRGKSRTRWLQNYPWPQEGGLRWHLFWKVL